MQLRVHEDTKGASQCKVRFHFLFKMIRKSVDQSEKLCDWDINSRPVQHLHLSKDTKKIMEVINYKIATVYKRINIEIVGDKTIKVDSLKQTEEDSGQ